MEQTYDSLEDQLRKLVTEFDFDHDKRHLAKAVRILAGLDYPKFRTDYEHLSNLLDNWPIDMIDHNCAMMALHGVQILSVLVFKYPRSLCYQIGQLAERLNQVILPGE